MLIKLRRTGMDEEDGIRSRDGNAMLNFALTM
jgi:hypothetical protein